MSKDKAQRIQELLQPRETVIYQAEMHPAIYSLPIIIFLMGAAVMFLAHSEIVAHLPVSMQDTAASSLQGAKESYLGFWMMGISVIFGFRFHMDSKHLIQIVTNRRVVQVKGTFATEEHALPLHHITDIKTKYGTVINRFLHRGNVILRNKKDPKNDIVFSGVSQPKAFIEHIRMAQERYAESLAVQERFEKERTKHA